MWVNHREKGCLSYLKGLKMRFLVTRILVTRELASKGPQRELLQYLVGC